MDISYFQKINNNFNAETKQESELFLLNRYVEDCFSDTIDYHKVKRNGEDYELLIIKDTDGNTFKKKIKCRPSQPFNLGDYIVWNGQTWLVTLLDPDDKTYSSGYMYLCSLLLRWQNEKGEIVERFGFAEDFTKYSSGEKGNSVITTGDYQYGITIPVDNETKPLIRGKRFAIDFEGNYPPDVYELTNRKIFLNDYTSFNRGGVMVWTLSYDAFNKEKDKLVNMSDDSQIWICDYISPTDPVEPDDGKSDILCDITGKSYEIKIGKSREYTAALHHSNGDLITDITGIWNIEGDSSDRIQIETTDNKVTVSIPDDDSLIGTRLMLIYTLPSGEKYNTTLKVIGIWG